ncbi:SH3 domain-containing protein [Oscillospiraceae bacterium WX1]
MRLFNKLFAVLMVLSVLLTAQYITAAAGSIAYGAATVSASSLNIRSGPDTSLPIVATVAHNEKMVVLEQTSSDWYRVNYNGTVGYVATMYLSNVLKAENFNAIGSVTGDSVSMRATPSTSGTLLCTCKNAAVVSVIGINNGWYKVKYSGKTGYIRSDFVSIVATPTPSGTTAAAQTGANNVTVTQLSSEQLSARQVLVDFATQYVGYNYVYGGASPSSGFDCSGLVYYVFRHFDYNVNRTASSQFKNDGTSVKKADLQPGDLVFFSSNGGHSVTHVGIYIGNNKFVHASTPKIGVVISSLDSDYYTRVWYGAKRVMS